MFRRHLGDAGSILDEVYDKVTLNMDVERIWMIQDDFQWVVFVETAVRFWAQSNEWKTWGVPGYGLLKEHLRLIHKSVPDLHIVLTMYFIFYA